VGEKSRQCTYKHNIQTRSRNQCYRGKAINITYSEYVFVALVIQHYTAIWLYCIFPHYVTNSTIFGKKLLNIKCVF